MARTPIVPPSPSIISRMSRPRSRDCEPGGRLTLPRERCVRAEGPCRVVMRLRSWPSPGRSLHFDDVGDLDLLVDHRLQHDEASSRIVVVEPHFLAHDVREAQRLDRILDSGALGAAPRFDRRSYDADGVVAAPRLQIRLRVVLRADLLDEDLVARRVDRGIVGPGADRVLQAAGLDDWHVAAAELDASGVGDAHSYLHGLAQEVDRVATDLEGRDGVRTALL